jgi:hypothetical protein
MRTLVLTIILAQIVSFERAVSLPVTEFNGVLTNDVLANWFGTINDVDYLSLPHRDIKAIASDTFRGLNKLQYLNMFSNQLTFLEPNTFIGLQNLRILNLGQFFIM